MGLFKCCDCGCDTPNSMDLGLLFGNPHYIIHRCDACEERRDMEFEFQRVGEIIRKSQMICPWCGYMFEPEESWGYIGVGAEDEVECPSCGKHFDLEVETHPRFSTKRSLCDMPEGWTPEDE